jgi:hypothetical protein
VKEFLLVQAAILVGVEGAPGNATALCELVRRRTRLTLLEEAAAIGVCLAEHLLGLVDEGLLV